jgi:hypothetical protein
MLDSGTACEEEAARDQQPCSEKSGLKREACLQDA